MALVRQSAQDLLESALADRLHTVLVEQARIQFDSGVGSSEVRSWRNSLPAFLTDIVDAGFGHVEVLLEHKLPHNPKRVDVILCGTHPTRHAPSYVLVELKQWSKAEPAGEDLVRIAQWPEPQLHPVEQVRRYCQYLVDSTPALDESAVHGLAYLHNAHDAGVWRISEYKIDEFGQLYTLDSKKQLAERLQALLDSDPATRSDANQAAEDLLSLAHAPSKPLLSLAAKEIQDREQFVLLDEQQVAFSLVRQAVERARTARQQTVLIVLGGPGSGKSVIALSLLGDLARRGLRSYHATGSSAFTNTLRKLASANAPRVRSMFKYFNNFIDARPRELDVLICDEAHRIRETSVNRFTKREARARARRQIDELIDVAWVPVFLLDEHQIVRPGEMGSAHEIREAAESLGCVVEEVRLSGQYRCGGSEFFDAWASRFLGVHRESAVPWSDLVTRPDEDFVVRSASTPDELEQWLLRQQDQLGGTARIAAGYCWRWSDPVTREGGKTLVPDVQIGDWRRPWNAKPDKRVPNAPESHYWASDTRGFGQVGCVYTAQGFEYDWAGVIFGPDFVRRDDRWIARANESHDPAVKRADQTQFFGLIRNTYKVLITRGMRGVCLYSTDPETQQYLQRFAR